MKQTLAFLTALDQNNHREWFLANKVGYEASYQEMLVFTASLISEMGTYDVLEPRSAKQSLFRIHRDVRFSSDKTPYKNNWGGFLKRAGAHRRGGYYFEIGPHASFVMGGFFAPNAADLLHIRNQLALYADPLREVLVSEAFKTTFGALRGNQVKSAPRGFPKDHEHVDLLRYKQFLVRHDFTRQQVTDKDFPAQMAAAFAAMLPFFHVMTDYLTTDLNGELLV